MDTIRKKKAPKKKRSKYWLGLLILALVNILLISLVLMWLYSTLSEYELHTPQNALTRYFTQLKSQEYDEIKLHSNFEPSGSDTWDTYLGILQQRFASADPANLTYRKTASRELNQDEELYAVYSGNEKLGEVILFPANTESGWAVRSEVAYLPGYTVTAPAGVQVFVNGTPLGEAEQTQAEVVHVQYEYNGRPLSVNVFTSLNNPDLAPTIATYETTPTLLEPEFTAETTFGSGTCDVRVDREARTVTVQVPITSEQEATFASTMEVVAKSYSDFITEDGPLANLRQYLYPDTSLYQDFSEYQTGWYLSHESRAFSDVTFSDITMQSDTCFTGHIDFTVTVTRGRTEHIFEPSYDMAFMHLDGEWLLVGLHARMGSTTLPAESSTSRAI